jgi:hypothetical protein
MNTFKIRYFFNHQTGVQPVIDKNNELDIDEYHRNGFREVFEEELTFCLVKHNQIMFTVDTLAKALALCATDTELRIALPYYPKSMNVIEMVKYTIQNNKHQTEVEDDLVVF